MEAVNLRQNLIHSINTLPSDMLEEMYKFLSFLEYKNLSKSDDSIEKSSDKNLEIDPYFYKRKKRLSKLREDIGSGKMPMYDFDSSMDELIRELKY